MPATIKIKNSSTASAVPTSSDLVQGELAVNVTDRRLFTENASGTVVELGTNPTILTMGAAGSASAPVITRTGDTNTGIFFPAADTIAFAEGGTEAMRLDSSGNMGLGVTPSAWSGFKAFEFVSAGTALWSAGAGDARLSSNTYYNGGYKFAATGVRAGLYNIDTSGTHSWNISTASGTAGNAISFTQAMTLDASGNLGLGTTSPTNTAGYQTIEANGSSGGIIRASFSTTVKGYFFSNSAGVTIGSESNDILAFRTNATERARIDTNGNLLVGQTTQSGTSNGISLTPAGAGSNSPAAYVAGAGTVSSAAGIAFYNTTASAYRFYVTYAGNINATSTTITGISDQRLKENIRDLDDGLEKVMALQPRKFDWREGKGANIKNARGFIAQEFEEVFPDLIDEWLDPAPEGEEPYKAVRADLIPTLVKAIQEQQAIIDGLTARITALEA